MKRIDFQVNGGLGYLFNDVDSVDELLRIELGHLKYGKTFIIPTFITDDFEKLRKFIAIVLGRIKLNENVVCIKNDSVVECSEGEGSFILPKFWGVHIEGPFLTNRGTHNIKFIRDFDEENVERLMEILSPLGDLPIYFTFAPELLLNRLKVENEKIVLHPLNAGEIEARLKLLDRFKTEFNLTVSAGHTFISKKDLERFEKLPMDLLTHFHNAMLEGHFSGDNDGIPSYIMDNGFDGHMGLITDGQHTAKGELIPTLLNYHDKICITSDAAHPSCCSYNGKNNLFEMGGNISFFEKKDSELPTLFWTDFSKADRSELLKYLEKFKGSDSEVVDALYRLYRDGELGYRTLAGSAVNLDDCYYYLSSFDINGELEKSKKNPKTLRLLKMGLEKNNLNESEIRNFIDRNMEKMFFENPVKALNINSDIYDYDIVVKNSIVELYKNNTLFIRFDARFDDFLKQKEGDSANLKKKLRDHLLEFFRKMVDY